MKYFIILPFLIFIVISCNQKSQTVQHSLSKTKSLVFNTNSKTYKLKISSDIINQSVCLFPYTSSDSTQYLYYLSGYTNKLCVFNLDTQSLEHIITLERRGPNGVGDVNGFEILSPDSILVTSNFRRELFLVNPNGEIISSINYSKYKQDTNIPIYAANSRSFENMRLGFSKSKIYVPFYPGYDEGNYKSIAPEDVRFIAEIDTSTRSAKLLNIGFPEDYWDKQYYPSFFGFFKYDRTFYVNYMYDDRVAISKDSKNWSYVKVKSAYIDIKEDILPMGRGVNNHYSRLVANPYRNEFYRFVVNKQKNLDGRTFLDMIRYPPRFSIMVLDQELNILGETQFPIDTYDMHGYFVTKEGLYLSCSNPFNPNYSIDTLEFRLLTLSHYEK